MDQAAQEHGSHDKHMAKVVQRMFALLGDADTAFARMNEDFMAITVAWARDTDTIGRILRSHLFVEHFMTECVENSNPNLGNVDDARLSFAQKTALLSDKNIKISYLLPGIRKLNSIRNRLAHNLSGELQDEDVQIFLKTELFVAFVNEGRRRNNQGRIDGEEPLVILEQFALHAGMILRAQHSEFSAAFAEALRLVKEEDEKEQPT